MGRADAAETHLTGFEEGNHEGLLVLGPIAGHQPRQLGVPPLAYRGRQGGAKLSLNQPLNMTITHI